MGLFSYNCKVCGHPLLAYRFGEKSRWMNRCVAIDNDNNIYKGEYDGYGRIKSEEDNATYDILPMNASVYHMECWRREGNPSKYTGPSEASVDQGFIFDPETEHNLTPEEAWEESLR